MNTQALFFVICSALIDVAANMMVARSEGFRRWRWGVGAIVMVWIAFALLGQAVRYMDLATAYAMWGAIGVIGTATCGRLLFGNRLRPIGWVGIALVTAAVLLLSTAK
ncbi:multidrug efflux SMR transporter [Stenotrophomonas maltophilia]|nr:multidrug efflux SMR transporter [Stenotrophomonas maltophilia]